MQDEVFPKREHFCSQSEFRAALLRHAKITYRDIAAESGRSKGMISHVMTGRFKSKPVADCIYGMIRARCPDMPFSFDEVW